MPRREEVILRRLVRESIGPFVAAGPNKGKRYIDVIMGHLNTGDIGAAANAIMNQFWIDDTWRSQEDALEDMLIGLGRDPNPEDVNAISKEWLNGVRQGKWLPETEDDRKADWARGATPRGKTYEAALRSLIRTKLNEIVTGSPEGNVELTEQPDEASISNAWPSNVTWNGHNVFQMFYESGAQKTAWGYLGREGYMDGQEVYLGYDPQSDAFIMGFDAFLDEVEEDYGYDDYDDGGGDFGGGGDSIMDGVMIELWPSSDGQDVMPGDDTIITAPGGMYPEGLREIEKVFPSIIHIRLD